MRCCVVVVLTALMVLGSTQSVWAAPTPTAGASYIVAVTRDANDVVYAGDVGSRQIWRLGHDGREVICKGLGKPRTPLYSLRSIALTRTGEVLATDSATRDVYRIAPDGEMVALTGGKMAIPRGIAVGAKGEIFATDLELAALYRIRDGQLERIAEVPSPSGLAIDKDGSFLVISTGRNNLYRVTLEGKVTTVVEGRKLSFPHEVVVEPGGAYLVSDGYCKAIWRVTRDGQTSVLAQGNPLVNPVGLAIDSKGSALVADPHARSIFRVTGEGQVEVVYKE